MKHDGVLSPLIASAKRDQSILIVDGITNRENLLLVTARDQSCIIFDGLPNDPAITSYLIHCTISSRCASKTMKQTSSSVATTAGNWKSIINLFSDGQKDSTVWFIPFERGKALSGSSLVIPHKRFLSVMLPSSAVAAVTSSAQSARCALAPAAPVSSLLCADKNRYSP